MCLCIIPKRFLRSFYILTLIGKGAFHGMGITAISSSKLEYDIIKRLKNSNKAVLSASSVKGTLYDGSSFKGLSKVKLRLIQNLTLRRIHAPDANLDLFWQAPCFFGPRNNPFPNWSSHTTTVYESSSVKFLPIIDLNPSDETCIYSTLLLFIEEAKKLNILSPCITFDQPLWQKSMGIIKEKKSINGMLVGGSHMLMSFLGSMGNLMNCSGLEKAFEEVYSEDTIKHIFSKHAVARAHSKGTYTGPECFSQSHQQHIDK